MFSCASSHYTSKTGGTSSSAMPNDIVIDLTTEIRKQSGVYVTGIEARASVYLTNQSCRPLFFLNGELIPDYRTLYNLVSPQRIKLVKIIQPRQAAVYGLRSSSGVILVTTKTDFLASENSIYN